MEVSRVSRLYPVILRTHADLISIAPKPRTRLNFGGRLTT